MTTATVPRDFPFLSRSGIASGKPVRAGQVAQVGHALNYLKGHGHTVLPAMRLAAVAIPPGTTYTYDAVFHLQPWTRHLVWSFRPRIDTAGGFATGTFTGPFGGSFAFSALRSEPEYRAITTEFRFVEAVTVASTSSLYFGAPGTFTIENDATSTHDLYVDTVQCLSLPRETLEDNSSDEAVISGSIGASLPIFDQAYYSLGGISRVIADGEDATSQGFATRNLFAWARPRGQGVAITGGSWTSIFAEGPCVQAHHRYRSETFRRTWANAIATADALTSGEVRFTAASGDVATKSVSSSTWGFPQGLDVYAEDLSTNDGRRSSTDDVITIEARVSSGVGNIYLHGLSIIDSVLAI